MASFCGWGATALWLDRATTRRQITFYRKVLVLIRSILERWKAEMMLKPSSGFEVVNQPSHNSNWLNYDSNCKMFQCEFSVISGRLIKNMFPLHICRPNDYTTQIIVLLQVQFYSIFTNVLSNIFKRFP